MKRFFAFLLAIIIVITTVFAVPFSITASSNYETEKYLSDVDLSEWMSCITGETKLTEISIPGTHDSCARKFANEDVFGVTSSISKCQSVNITEQLNLGVRYLDIRCEVDASSHSVKTVHGSTDCWNGNDYYYLDFVLQEIYNWLNQHPSETVLVSIKEDHGDVGAPVFTQAVYEYIHGYGQGKYFYGSNYNYNEKWYLGKSVPTLDSVRGKCVLMNRFDQYIPNSSSGVDENESGQKTKWSDQGDSSYSSPVYINGYNANTGVGTFHVQDHYNWSTSDKLSATQEMLNLGHWRGEYYINFTSTTTGATVPNPKDYANTINSGFVKLNFTKNKPSGIIVMDFINTDCARRIVENNEAVSTVVRATDGNITYSLNRLTGVLEISGNGEMKNYQYTSSVGSNGAGSTAPWGDSPQNSLFDGRYNSDIIKTIIINEGVTSIGSYAFYGFDNVINISIPYSVRLIGAGAFTKCSSLSSVTLKNTLVNSVGNYAFKDCTALTSFNTTDRVGYIASNAFENIKSTVVMYGESGIYSQSFANDNSIKYVVTGAYNADTDWFTSRASYYEPFDKQINGTPVTNSVDNGNYVRWVNSNLGRNGVAFIPWSIDRSGSNYIETKCSAVNMECGGVTISFFRQIGGNYYDGAALTLAQDKNNYFAIYDNGKIYYKNGDYSASCDRQAADVINKKWQFFTITVDKNEIKLYIDGVLNNTMQSSIEIVDFLCNEATCVYPGSYIDKGTCSLYLDEISILPIALSFEEIKAMYLSYNEPEMIDYDIEASDANIVIQSSNGYENVIYTHGTNSTSAAPLTMAADYMFKGKKIADGDNDSAYVYSSNAIGQENELYTTLSINSKYSVNSIVDNHSNSISFYLKNNYNGTKTYMLSGSLNNGYIDGSDDYLNLDINITDGESTYINTESVFVTTHPVSANASSAIYRQWSSGTAQKFRDSAVFMKFMGSTGTSNTYYSGNYVFTSTPVHIGNSWCFASNTNADSHLMIGDGRQGNDLSSAFPATSSADITNAGCYAQSNDSSSSSDAYALAQGATANYYVDLSSAKGGETVGGVTLSYDKRAYTINSLVTRLSPRHKGTIYGWTSGSGISTSSGISWNTGLFTAENAESIGTSGINDSADASGFAYVQPILSGSLNGNPKQTATLTAGIYHATENYSAEGKINIVVNICDKSTLRSLVKSYEQEGLTGKSYSVEGWKKYKTALSKAYEVLNNYKDTREIDSQDEIYCNLAAAHDNLFVNRAAFDNAVEQLINCLDNKKLYKTSSIIDIIGILNSDVSDQTKIDINAGKIVFLSRFIEQLSVNSAFSDVDNAVSLCSNPLIYDIDAIQRIKEEFYNTINYSFDFNEVRYSYKAYYSQVSFDRLVDDAIDDINNEYMYYSVNVRSGNVVKADNNPFAGKDLSNGVTLSFSKFCQYDGDWNTSLISFSTGDSKDNQYFIIMANGTILFNDGNGGSGGFNNCYFDILKNKAVNTSTADWYDIDITIFKADNGNHILKYYIDNTLVRTVNISQLCASGYPYGVSGNDGIFSFLASDNINLYYGASFSIYGSMAGTQESCIDNVVFCDYAKTEFEISGENTESLKYTNSFDNGLGGTAYTGNADNGYKVYNQTSDNNGRASTAYFPWSGTNAQTVNYVNTNTNPFYGCNKSRGFTISYWQRINGNYYSNTQSITFAKGSIDECKYFTIGTDGYVRFNNGNGGSDVSLSNSGLYFDYTSANSEIVNKKWQLVTFEIIDDFNFKVYIDGRLSKSVTIKGTENYNASGGLIDFITSRDTTMYLGSYTPYWGTCTLSLDNIKCFNTVLSSVDVNALYNYEVSNTIPVHNEGFDTDIPERVSGSCKWLSAYGGHEGVLYIPVNSADGDVTYYIDGNEVSSLDNIRYGDEISIEYSGIGRAIQWNCAVSNSDSYSSYSCGGDRMTLTVTGNTLIDYIAENALTVQGDYSALLAAIETVKAYNAYDYSADSTNNLMSIVSESKYLLNGAYIQSEIDKSVTKILNAINDLVPYLNLKVSAPNGSCSVTYNGETAFTSIHSLLFGTDITLNAFADDGYEFVGWYDTVNNRYMSSLAEYTFKITGNINLKAVFVKQNSASLTFMNYSNWIQSTVTKTIEEWNILEKIDELLPEIPYRYGYSNGRWVYDNTEVLSALKTGQNVSVIAEYDKDDTSLPSPPKPDGDTPVIDLYYKLDADNNVGSFVMSAGVPQECKIESVGTAFYYKKAKEFDPTGFILNVNNKMLLSRFNTEETEDVYITNMNNFSAAYSWAVRGYITYYDDKSNLKTVYSNQINIINREQV